MLTLEKLEAVATRKAVRRGEREYPPPNYQNLLQTAEQILLMNPDAYLGGTLMLKLRGISLGREPQDIDIIIDYVDNFVEPKEMTDCSNMSSNEERLTYELNGIKIDILESDYDEEAEVIEDLRCGSIKGLVDAKLMYTKSNKMAGRKHTNDLRILSYRCPEHFPDSIPF